MFRNKPSRTCGRQPLKNLKCDGPLKILLKRTLKSKFFYLLQWKPLKKGEKCFLFHFKSFFILKVFKFWPWLVGHVDKNLVSIYFDSPQLGNKNELYIKKKNNKKNRLYKTLDYWSRDMLNFDFLEMGLGVFSPPHFVYGFLLFLSTHEIPNCNVWLPLLREILGSMCIAIVYFPECDVINFEIKLIFLIKLLLHGLKVRTKI